MSNSQLKFVRKLYQKKFRNEFKLFVAEGLRLCEEVPPNQIEFGFFTRDFLSDERATNLIERIKNFAPLEEISTTTFEKISDTQTPQGILLVVRQKFSTLEEVIAKKIIAVLDGVQDPGNVGTILRTAEAFDCGIILLEGAADIFNPKVVRSTMGAIFNLSVAEMSCENFLTLAKAKKFEVTAAALDDSAEIYFKHNFKKKSAVVFGNEAGGVSEKISKAAKKIFIPMSGKAESLNVATAAAIIVSEAMRQKS